MYTSSHCLCSSFCHSFPSSVKCPSTFYSVRGFLRAFFLPGAKQHLTKCSGLAFIAYFWSTLLLVTFVHLAAASSQLIKTLKLQQMKEKKNENNNMKKQKNTNVTHFFLQDKCARFKRTSDSEWRLTPKGPCHCNLSCRHTTTRPYPALQELWTRASHNPAISTSWTSQCCTST